MYPTPPIAQPSAQFEHNSNTFFESHGQELNPVPKGHGFGSVPQPHGHEPSLGIPQPNPDSTQGHEYYPGVLLGCPVSKKRKIASTVE